MVRRVRVTVVLGVSLLVLTACGWDITREQFADEATIDQRITRVRVDNDSGDVVVRAAQRTAVRRQVHHNDDRPGTTHRVEGDVLVIEPCPVPQCWISYEVTVPPGTRVDATVGAGSVELWGTGEVNLTAGSGEVAIRDATGGVHVDIGSGLVEVANAADAVVVEIGTGDLTLAGARGPVTVRASSGAIDARGLSGPASIDSASGDVSVHLASPADVRVRAESGDVTLLVPNASYRVTTDAGDGTVESGVRGEAAGAHHLDLHTDSGDITVRHS